MFFIAYALKGQVHVFAGQVKIVSHVRGSNDKSKLICSAELGLTGAVWS